MPGVNDTSNMDSTSVGCTNCGKGSESEVLPKKVVSDKAMRRLQMAQEAIAYAKGILVHGAGNIEEQIRATNYNVVERREASRTYSCFNEPPETRRFESDNEASEVAYMATMAELAGGGNCNEHAAVVFDYLRLNYPDEQIQMIADPDPADHVFVMIGDPINGPHDELVIADAWTMKPTAVLWQDHINYGNNGQGLSGKSLEYGDPVNGANQANKDTRNYKQEMKDAGFSLSDEGRAKVNTYQTPEKTEELISEGKTEGWIWNASDATYTARSDSRYNYTTS